MSEYKRPSTEQEFDKNFAQIKPSMSDTEAYYESSRCLFCYDAPCVNACPSGIDIPLFIRQINSKNNKGAAKTIYDANYLGYACGKVCPTEVLCEGACVYNHSDVKPIEIGRLQTYATAEVVNNNVALYKPAADNGKKIAIIGAGPAGIGCACELRLLGYTVDVYESKNTPTGLTVHGVAPYKITNDEALREAYYLEQQFGYTVIYNHPIATAEHIAMIEKKYHAVFIGTGLHTTGMLHIPGEQCEGVHGAVEFVAWLRQMHHQVVVPPNVVVLGGGNTAMDAASECARMGAHVTLVYRKSKEHMGAYEFEYDLALSAGITSMFGYTPTAIQHLENKVTAIKVTHANGSEQTIPCQWVIKATGQSKQTALYTLIHGLQLDGAQRIIVNEHFQTTNSKYFAAGDAVSGGQEVVNAVANGKKAARSIHAQLAQ